MAVLVLNCGSSSVKYAIIDATAGKTLHAGVVERVTDHVQALTQVLGGLGDWPIEAVGHRVVHGGEHFHDARLLDDGAISKIEACIPLAPLHNPANLAGIRAARKALPLVPHVAVFDTAFHNRLPRRARTYGLDPAISEELGIRRYGFHGPSHAYVSQEVASHLVQPLNSLRLVTLHLGNGASACAVEYGRSADTSMGMTPLEGLVMGTRSGDLDPGIVLAMLRSGRSVDEVDDLLNRGSGLAGLASSTGDLRDIEQRAANGDDRARMAVAVFAHRARKYVGAYAAVMGGVDAVVLTGGIGENSPSMRLRILQRLEFLGALVDIDRNMVARPTREQPVVALHAENSRVKLFAVATDEQMMIARDTTRVVGDAFEEKAQPIPIAVSARHIHLDEATFKTLFGADATPTKLHDISQPGQYACEQTMSVIGPRNRIDGVRLLGPLRSANQVEVSRTDEFTLGVDAPVRDSGKVKGSAPVTLEGPAGTVHLEEGLICARRHIHMPPDAAKRHGVKDRDEVEVAITGGPRDLIFGDVLVRVNENYVLEMHLDTDEANAAEMGRGATGELVYTPVLGAQAGIQEKRSKP